MAEMWCGLLWEERHVDRDEQLTDEAEETNGKTFHAQWSLPISSCTFCLQYYYYGWWKLSEKLQWFRNTKHFVTKTDKFHRIQHKNIFQTVQIHAELYESERTVNRPYHRISVCIKKFTTLRMVDSLLPRVYSRPTYALLFSLGLHKTILIVIILYKWKSQNPLTDHGISGTTKRIAMEIDTELPLRS